MATEAAKYLGLFGPNLQFRVLGQHYFEQKGKPNWLGLRQSFESKTAHAIEGVAPVPKRRDLFC